MLLILIPRASVLHPLTMCRYLTRRNNEVFCTFTIVIIVLVNNMSLSKILRCYCQQCETVHQVVQIIIRGFLNINDFVFAIRMAAQNYRFGYQVPSFVPSAA